MSNVEHKERPGAGHDSGAAMKVGWETKPLGDLCMVIGGGTPSKNVDEYYTGHIPWATVRDMRSEIITETECTITKEAVKNSATNIVPAGNVVIATRVGLGKICLIAQDTAINQDLRGIVPNNPNKLAVGFLHLWLKSIAHLIVAEGTGATVQGVKLPFIKSLKIPLPPLSEQQRIVAILDEAFAGIATAKANAEKNLLNARAVFESYLAAVFSQRGAGWVETTLDKLSTNLDNKRIPITKSDRSSGKYPYYGASGIVDYVNNYIFDGDTLLISEDGANLIARSTPIAFSVSGKYWVNNHAHILKFNNMATQKYIEFYLKSIKLDEFITGTAQPKLNQKALNSIPIPIPNSIDAQAKIVNCIELLMAETQRLESIYQQKLVALEALKKSLLQRAFCGEL
ncbi:MAG: restriction endonuclease subunit S [bacterium]